MFKRLARSLFSRANVKVGSYVLLAVPDEDTCLEIYERFKAMSTDNRLRIINPLKPYDRQTHHNCYIQQVSRPITRGFYQVVGLRDGIVVKVIQKHHPRSKSNTFDAGFKYSINLNNILDVAKDRDEMIVKRNQLK